MRRKKSPNSFQFGIISDTGTPQRANFLWTLNFLNNDRKRYEHFTFGKIGSGFSALSCLSQACESSDNNLNSDFFFQIFRLFSTWALYKSKGAYQISDFILVVLAIFRLFS